MHGSMKQRWPLINTYFIYPLEEGFNSTKIQFAVEYFYKLSRRSEGIACNKNKQ